MTLKKQLKRQFGKKTTRRIYAAMPWVSGMLALAGAAYLERRGTRGVMEDIRNLPSSLNNTARRASAFSSDASERDREFAGTR